MAQQEFLKMISLNESDYDLELDRITREIKKHKARRVLIQLPDGLKPQAVNIVKELKKHTKAEIFIWAGSCYGACDVPLAEAEKMKVDLIVQFGHSAWDFKNKGIRVIK